MEGYQSWIRLTKVDLIGLFIFLLYLITSLAYLAARCYYSLNGLGNQKWCDASRHCQFFDHAHFQL